MSYLQKPDGETRARVLEALHHFSGGKPISSLFARLAVERVAGGADTPASAPELIHDYVVALQPSGPRALRESDFLRAARGAAYACVASTCLPVELSEERLVGWLQSEGTQMPFEAAADEGTGRSLTATEIIDQLVRCGLLQRQPRLGEHRVRFAEDTIGEYLCAFHALSRGGSVLDQLETDLAEVGDAAKPLAQALADVRAASGS